MERSDELKALDDACDVAIWLSGFVPPEGDAWKTWETSMRPKLFAAMRLAVFLSEDE